MDACYDTCRDAIPPQYCDNGEERPYGDFCDGLVDCKDGSDELGCPQFTCDDGYHILEDARCDGATDCPDGSDEEACPGIVTIRCGDDDPDAGTTASTGPDTEPCVSECREWAEALMSCQAVLGMNPSVHPDTCNDVLSGKCNNADYQSYYVCLQVTMDDETCAQDEDYCKQYITPAAPART